MKRSPLQRHTPLKAGKALRRTPMQRGTPVARKRRRPTDPITAATKMTVVERSGGVCEVCALARATHMHHRLLRRHGDHSAANLLHVCAKCHWLIHNDWCASGLSYDKGYLLRPPG